VLIRNGVEGDEKRIEEFATALVEQHVGYDGTRFTNMLVAGRTAAFYQSRFSDRNSCVLVAEVDGEIAGFAYLEFDEYNFEEMLRKGIWLHDIYVDAAFRGRGIAKELLRASAEEAKRFGAEKLLLTVAAKNAGAQKVFAKAGFRQTMMEMTLDIPGEM
jgi:ribosomal protein S18 acetylase RimI-like enzyme